MTQVTPIPGAYTVTVIPADGKICVFTVGKDRSCTCGHDGNGNGRGPHCLHVRAVEAYLRAGGKRAPVAPPPGRQEQPPARSKAATPRACPICGARVQNRMPYHNRYTGRPERAWRCVADAGHYFLWRLGEARARQSQPDEAARRRLTAMYRRSGAPDERIAAFLDETWEKRQAFVAVAQARLAEYDVYA